MMNPSIRRSLILPVAVGAWIAVAVSCSDGNGVDEKPLAAQQTRSDVVKNLALNVAAPQIQECAEKLAVLDVNVEAWRDSPADETRAEAQQAWVEAYRSWQRCELLQLGPAGTMEATVGGEGLRFDVYTYPLLSDCYVDELVANESWRDLSSYRALPTSKKGLGALEYLLYRTGTANACHPTQNPINADGTWAALSEAELNQRRADLAAFIASGIASVADDLASRWVSTGDAYVDELADAGHGSASFRSAQDALNEFSNAMVYLEKEVKDMKLASPLGISTTSSFSDCESNACPELRESPWANQSLSAITANLRMFESMYYGGDGVGFDDLLRELGAGTVAETMEEHLRSADTALAAIDGTLLEALEQDHDDVVAFYEEVRELVTLFKTQFVNVLSLELPNRAAADGD